MSLRPLFATDTNRVKVFRNSFDLKVIPLPLRAESLHDFQRANRVKTDRHRSVGYMNLGVGEGIVTHQESRNLCVLCVMVWRSDCWDLTLHPSIPSTVIITTITTVGAT